MIEEVAYQLSWDLDHFEKYDLDETHDVDIVEYANYDKWAIYETESFVVPNPIIYSGYPPVARYLDYPYTDNDWSVMSRRMYETLVNLGDFPHRALPTAVIDGQVPQRERFQPDGKLRPEIVIKDFVTIHLTEHLEIFDWEQSDYTRSEHLTNHISVDEYVFKSLPEKLPPLFRVTAQPVALFISAAARQALKRESITGTRYISLKNFKDDGGDFVDVPVKLQLT